METAGEVAPTAPSSLEPGADDGHARRERTAERRARVLRRYQEGWTARAIAREEGVWSRTIDLDFRALGVRPRPAGRSRFTERARRRRRVAELRARDLSMRAISEETGIPYSAVRNDCIALGLKTPAPNNRPFEQRRAKAAELRAAGRTVQVIAVELGGPALEPRTCARPGCERTFRAKPSRVAKGYGKYCSRPCSFRDRWWRTGRGISDVLLDNIGPDTVATRREWKGRWAGRKPSRRGRKRRGARGVEQVDPETVEKVIRCAAAGKSERAIALMTGRSRGLVRRLKADYAAEIDAARAPTLF